MAIEVVGVQIPLWLLFLIVILVLFIGWKLIKFAVKLLIILVLLFSILMIGDLIWPYLSSWL
ncbi:MAG: hypothetical protein KGY55_01145 [Candidatus Thermoplasmatota archaeon]|nr:hypothetical protein [Candidatus Thermoplasmatota archaeon]